MVRIVRGDLLETNVPYICHQVNCKGVMGAGVARQIADKWPSVFRDYKRLCDKTKNKSSLLGTVQFCETSEGSGGAQSPVVINIFGQFDYGRNGVYTDYSALSRAFKELNSRLKGKTIAFPHGIGCGLAGGDWMDVEQLIVKCMPDCDVRICLK